MTDQPETRVSVTLSIRDWLVIGGMLITLVAWSVRLETRVGQAEKDDEDRDKRIERLEDRVDRALRRYGPTTDDRR